MTKSMFFLFLFCFFLAVDGTCLYQQTGSEAKEQLLNFEGWLRALSLTNVT
jgi:hypothetical protein